MGADDEARQHIVALAQRFHQFGHQTEERELEMWHRLSNAAIEEPALAGTSTVAQPTPEKTVPARTFLSILEEDVVSVKDSVTSGLFAHVSMEGTEAGGSSGHPVTPQFKLVEVSLQVMEALRMWEKRHSCHKKEKNGSCQWV